MFKFSLLIILPTLHICLWKLVKNSTKLTKNKIAKLARYHRMTMLWIKLFKKQNMSTHFPFVNSAIKEDDDVNVRIGRRANGNCRLIRTLRRSFRVVMSSIPEKMAIRIVGIIATVLVSNTLCQRFHFRFRKPCRRSQKFSSL